MSGRMRAFLPRIPPFLGHPQGRMRIFREECAHNTPKNALSLLCKQQSFFLGADVLTDVLAILPPHLGNSATTAILPPSSFHSSYSKMSTILNIFISKLKLFFPPSF
jgi:hypothetical protein